MDLAPLLPWWASASVLARLEDADGITAKPPHHLAAFVLAGLVVLVAEVVRAGAPGAGGRRAPAGPGAVDAVREAGT